MKKKQEKHSLQQLAYDKLKKMISLKRFSPGQKLVYADLCKILKMSRSPIINALYRLEEEGFLYSETFRGFSIKPLDKQEAFDLYGVREALESFAVEQAAQRGNIDDIEIVEEKARNHAKHTPHYYDQKKLFLDAEFHLQLARATRNQILVKTLRMNLEHIYLRYPWESVHPSRMQDAIQEHFSLLQRIKDKDIIGSVEAIRLHVRIARDNAISALSKREEGLW